MDYSQYRLTNWDWTDQYKKSMGETEYFAYKDKVVSLLDTLQPGYFYDIENNVSTENIDLFMKICCMWILTNPNYDLSRDYTKIRRRK